MESSLAKLLEIASPSFVPTDVSLPIDHSPRFYGITGTICEVLARKNGFFCFESALRFFPSITVEQSWGASDWNAHGLWKEAYGGRADGLFCFAEELFGRQFVVHDDGIAVFEPETGEIETIASSLNEWASKLLLDYENMTGYSIGHQWQAVHGPLPPRHRLMARKPFVLGGEYSVENLVSLDSIRIMRTLGNLAQQIHDLPDGAQIQFRIV